MYSIRMYQNLPFFMKNCKTKMTVFESKIEFFWPQTSS